jgi:outer membrane receptor protein involved in Fe transport
LVPAEDRGSVDVPANSEHGTLDAGGAHRLGANGQVFLRGNFLLESRNNGTPIQVNNTDIASGVAGLDQRWHTGDTLQLRFYGDVQSYNQSFSAIAADRDSESLTNLQHVPAQQTAGQAQWSKPLGSHTLVAGADLIEVIGESDEQLFSSGTHFANNLAGGRQRTLGFYGEDVIRWHNWTVIPAARVDYWQNFDGRSIRTILSSGAQTGGPFQNRTNTAFDPKLAVFRPVSSNLSVTASVYRAFRAPTLNELYRTFRQGNVVTGNNPALQAERLTGAEAGGNVSLLDKKLLFRGTFFWNEVTNPVANVTLSTTPDLIIRQRQNLGRTRSLGVEIDGTYRVSEHVDISGGYAYVNAKVASFPAQTSLVGLDVPQVPQNQFTVSARYWNPAGWTLSAIGRFVGTQYDNDLNTLPLDRFFTVDLMGGRQIRHGVTLFAAIENLANVQYFTALTPVPNLGLPFQVRGGIRLALAKDTQ